MHLSKTAEHGTPVEIIAGAHLVLEGIDLDPASSVLANEVVRADTFYDQQMDGLVQPWKGTVWLNPPGDKSGTLVKKFWNKLVRSWACRDVPAALYLGFSISQLQQLQNTEVGGPLKWEFPLCIPRKRLCFTDLLTGEIKTQPTHCNFIAYLPSADQAGTDRFVDVFSQFGDVR
jgi:hypothetical protein